MTFRLHTSLQTQETLKLFEARDHLPPYISAKIAIALAIRSVDKIEGSGDSSGLELNRQTLLGASGSAASSPTTPSLRRL